MTTKTGSAAPLHLVLAELRELRGELRQIREELLAPKVAHLRELHALGQTLAERGRNLISATPSVGEQAEAIAEAVYTDLRGRLVQLVPVILALAPHAREVLADVMPAASEG